MIREFFETLRTPVSKEARRLGYLYETVALKARHRRCAASWKSHIESCHKAVLKAVGREKARLDTMLILGSGPLMEIPMEDLLKKFRRLVLVDFVHPRDVRRRWGGHPQVELAELDLLGIAQPLLSWRRGLPLPAIRPPDLKSHNAGFVLSANCLSQLALIPRQHLQSKVGPQELDAYSEALSAAHLQQLKSLSVPHLVIADFETKIRDKSGVITAQTEPFFERKQLRLHESWTWHLAPHGEIYRRSSVEMSVGAFTVL